MGQGRPEPITCQIPESSSTDTELQKLTACKDAMVCYSKIINYNDQIIQFNGSQKELLKASLAAWRNREEVARRVQKEWDNRKAEFKRSIESERQRGSCAAAWHCANSNCPSGWVNDGSVHGAQGNCPICFMGICADTGCSINCKKADDVVEREATNQTIREKGQRPADFSEREPKQEDFPLTEQNQTSINMNCCSNYMNVTGSAKENIQSCQQEIQQRINNPPPPPAPAPPPPPAPAPAPSPSSTPASVPVEPSKPKYESEDIEKEEEQEQEPSQKISDKNMYIIIGILLALLISVIFLFYFQDE